MRGPFLLRYCDYHCANCPVRPCSFYRNVSPRFNLLCDVIHALHYRQTPGTDGVGNIGARGFPANRQPHDERGEQQQYADSYAHLLVRGGSGLGWSMRRATGVFLSGFRFFRWSKCRLCRNIRFLRPIFFAVGIYGDEDTSHAGIILGRNHILHRSRQLHFVANLHGALSFVREREVRSSRPRVSRCCL